MLRLLAMKMKLSSQISRLFYVSSPALSLKNPLYGFTTIRFSIPVHR